MFVFFSSRKTVLKNWLDASSIPCYLSSFSSLFLNAISTPPWYLMNRSKSSCLLDSSSTPGGSIEILFLNLILCCSILSWYLSCRWPLSRHLPRQLHRLLPIPQLSSITKGSYLNLHHDPSLISSISLDLSTPVHLPNTLFFIPNLFLKVSSSFFKFFYTW